MRATVGIDTLQLVWPLLPSILQRMFPHRSELTIFSYYLLSVGLWVGLATILSGALAASSMLMKKEGIYENKATKKAKTAKLFVHAGLNDVVILLFAGCWWARKNSGGAAYIPDLWMVGLTAALLCMQLFAARLGQALAIKPGIGNRNNKFDVKDQ